MIGGPGPTPPGDDAVRAEREADVLLRMSARAGVTVAGWWTDWTTDLLWLRPSESTNIHNRERTAKFAAAHGDKPIRAIDDDVVAGWLGGGHNRATVPLRAMFNDASSVAAGRLVTANPFSNLRLPSSRGRKDIMPPDQSVLASMLSLARELMPPSFAAYVVVGAHTAMRPGELDGLRTEYLDFQKREHRRTVAMTPPAYEALLALPRQSEYAFMTLRGTHYTPSARVHHWNRVGAPPGSGPSRSTPAPATSSAGTCSTSCGSTRTTSPSSSATATAASWSVASTATPTPHRARAHQGRLSRRADSPAAAAGGLVS